MKTKICLTIVLVLLCVLAVALQPTPAMAADTVTEGFAYEITNGTVTITGYTGTATELTIPSSIEGCSVNLIASDAFSGCSFSSVVLPETLAAIGHRAFQSCTALNQVSYAGTSALWQDISIGVYNDSLLNAQLRCLQDSPSETPETQAPSDPIQIVEEAYALVAGATLPYSAYLSGEIIAINSPYSEAYGNITVTIQVPGAEDMPIQCYRLCGAGIEQLDIGDQITVWGDLYNYVGSTIEFKSGCQLIALANVKASAIPTDPLQILEEAYALESGASLNYAATLTGQIQSVNTPYDAYYKNITVTMTVDGAEDKPVQCYRLSGDGVDQISVGDEITVKGQLANYNGSIQFNVGSLLISWTDNSQNEPDGQWRYEATATYVVITGYSGSESHVVIPDVLADLPVTGIRDNAFYGNYTMTAVTIPESLTSCGERAFYCPNLNAVHITDLEAWCRISFNGAWSNPLSFGNNLYLNGELMKHVVIPDTLTSIGGAFPACTSIVSVCIPDSITSIGAYAFDGCSNLQHVLYAGTTDQWSNISVGTRNAALFNAARHEDASEDAFTYQSGCAVDGYLCSICDYTILSVKQTATHNYVDGICTICGTDEAWSYEATNGGIKITGYSGYESTVSIPEALEGFPVVSVAGDMFTNVVSVKIPASVTQIENGYFGNCYGLTGIWVDKNNTVYSSDSRGVLFNKDQTQLLRAPRGISGQYTVPDTVTGIDHMAFSFCDNLTSVTIPASVTQIGDTPVYGSSKVTGIWVDENNTAYSSDSYGVLFNKDKTQLMEAPDALTGVYVIPDTVTSIAYSAFYHCSVGSVVIPEGVTTLEDCAFCCADITSVTIPSSVTSIGRAAFNLCMYLTDVSYTGTCAQWENVTIDDYNDPLLAAAPNLNHTYSDWVVTVQPTLSAGGQREKTCTGCGDVISEELPMVTGKVDSWNISLSNDLVVTFRMNISQSIESTARVRIYVGGDTYTFRAANMEKTADGLYIASVNIAAAQMSDYIFVTVLNGSDIADTAVYTVRQYADTLLADESYSQYHALVREMLNYGAAAQDYFDYCEDTMANEGITGAGSVQIPDSVDEEMTVTGSAEGVSFYATSLVFRDKIAVRYYFRFSGDINSCTFTANGKICTPQLKNGLYYVEVADILPENLDQAVELTVSDANGNTLTVCYSPMNYIVRMNEKGSDSLKALLTALYNYHLAARELRTAA